MIVDLSRMLQYTSQSRKQLVHLKDDIDWLKRYIEIMQIRYENQFEVNFDIPEELMEKEVPSCFYSLWLKMPLSMVLRTPRKRNPGNQCGNR